MKLSKSILLFLLTAAFVAGCASTTDPTAAYKNDTAEQIFRQAEISLAKGNESTAATQFEALDALYPFSPYDQQAQLDLMYAYYENGDVASTAATADRYIRLYPVGQHVDYAYYMKGLADFSQDRGWLQRYFPSDLSQRDPGTTKQAFTDFNQLVQLFPGSPYAADARQRMVYLRNLFAEYEINVANYYWSRHAYVAVVNRANYVLEHYNGTPQTEAALVLLVKAYRALGLTNLANQSLQILQINFPHNTQV